MSNAAVERINQVTIDPVPQGPERVHNMFLELSRHQRMLADLGEIFCRLQLAMYAASDVIHSLSEFDSDAAQQQIEEMKGFMRTGLGLIPLNPDIYLTSDANHVQVVEAALVEVRAIRQSGRRLISKEMAFEILYLCYVRDMSMEGLTLRYLGNRDAADTIIHKVISRKRGADCSRHDDVFEIFEKYFSDYLDIEFNPNELKGR